MRELPLGEALEVLIDHRGKTPKKLGGDFSPTGVPVVSALSVKGGRLNLTAARKIPWAIFDRWMPVRTKKYDVVLTSEAPLGSCALVQSDEPMALGQRLFGLRGRRGVLDGRFLFYVLQSESIQGQLYGRSSGTTVLGIRQAELVRVRVPVPGISEQEAIAEVLGALDDKIALNERIRETALGLAGACYEAARTGDEPEIIGDLAELFDGPHATPKKTTTGPWFLSISSLKNGYLDLSESAHLSEEDFPRWTRRVQPQAGDVLFSYETRLGDAALMPPGTRSSLGRRMALLRSKSADVSGSLLLHAYLSPAFQGEIKRRTVHGATVDRLPLKEMPGWRILLPARGERERLSVELDALHASVTQTANENRTLADLRDTLLPQLLSGKIRVKDAVRTVEEVV
ncbi:restriction endonuclease subunit S [Streptomyces tendae]|uniref:restriction endonuclease subunit S n=1 Tax=Streptomyces tendae TaxID=1932 RepID=UPI0037FAD3FE